MFPGSSMAATNLSASITFRPPAPEFTQNRHKPLIFLPYYNKRIPTCSTSSPPSTTIPKPEIELEFIRPKPDEKGNYPMDKAKAVSGEKLLRNIMSDNKIELYAAYGKVMNCGGGGSCGTCIVEIIDGKDLLNERTNTEVRYLKKGYSKIVMKMLIMDGRLVFRKTCSFSLHNCAETGVMEIGLPNYSWK